MLKVYSAIYRSLLVIIVILYFYVIVVVGTAGHVRNNNEDYYWLTFAVVTFFSLTYCQKLQGKMKYFIKYSAIILVLAGALMLAWDLYRNASEEYLGSTELLIYFFL